MPRTSQKLSSMPVQICVSMKVGMNTSARLKNLAEICQMLFQQLTWNTEGNRNSYLVFETHILFSSISVPSIEFCLHQWKFWIQMLLQNHQQSNNGREICFIFHLKLTEKLYQNNHPHNIFSSSKSAQKLLKAVLL